MAFERSTPGSRICWPPSAGERAGGRSELLVDLDDDLAQELDPVLRPAIRRRSRVRTHAVRCGPCELAPWFDALGNGAGLLIVDGLIAVETRIGDRTACELAGAGDLLQAPAQRVDELLVQHEGWRALWPTTFAVLDEDFVMRVTPWPELGLALLRRGARRLAELDALRAIVSQPRLEMRLVLLLWHLGSRWGRVEPGGIRLTLPLTHRLIGQLVAAERPSVSHALARLSHHRLVTGAASDLHLHGTLEAQLATLLERGAPPRQPVASAAVASART